MSAENRRFRIQLRVVYYKDDGEWVARVLEFDLVGVGATKRVATQNLVEAIACQLQATLELNNPSNLFRQADERYFQMFAAGSDIGQGSLSLMLEGIERDYNGYTIEDVTAREYDDDELVTC